MGEQGLPIGRPAFARAAAGAGKENGAGRVTGTSWVSSLEMQQAAQTPDNAQAPGMMTATSNASTLPMSANAFSAQDMIQYPSSPQSPPAPSYMPGDLRPITTALPRQLLSQSPQEVSGQAPAGTFHPLSMDSLDLPPDLTKAIEERATPAPSLPPDNLELVQDYKTEPEPEEDHATIQELSSPPPTEVNAPSIKDDPVLETVMRQAQEGLFILQGREKSPGITSNPGLA